MIEGLDNVFRNLDSVVDDMAAAAAAAGDEIAHLLASYAKGNHPWKPETGATDASTKGEVIEATREFVTIALSAGMEYDVFLELAREGRWAWLWPAVEANRENIMQILVRRLKQ